MTAVDRIAAAWSYLTAHQDLAATAAAFPDLVAPSGLDRGLLELWAVELHAAAEAATERAREAQLDLRASRVELAYSVILRACEQAMEEYDLTAGEAAAAALVFATLTSAVADSAPSEQET